MSLSSDSSFNTDIKPTGCLEISSTTQAEFYPLSCFSCSEPLWTHSTHQIWKGTSCVLETVRGDAQKKWIKKIPKPSKKTQRLSFLYLEGEATNHDNDDLFPHFCLCSLWLYSGLHSMFKPWGHKGLSFPLAQPSDSQATATDLVFYY